MSVNKTMHAWLLQLIMIMFIYCNNYYVTLWKGRKDIMYLFVAISFFTFG